ncbi:MAG: hypothetical protein LBL39_04130, partial [Planctomycetaceae bacterium]|nr:hypothetical protein [Planctomycetaceae bacterium]
MNIIEKTKTIRKKVVEIYLLFCFYSLPFCGLVMLPGLFFSWWELHISYPFVVILGVIIPMIAVLSLVVMVTVLFLTKKSKSDPSIMSVLKIGKICFSSDVYFFNDDPDIHNAEERVVLKAAEFNIFLFIDNDYQVGILQLSTSESYSPLGEIIKDDII